MKLICVARSSGHVIFDTYFIGNEESPEPEKVLHELNYVNKKTSDYVTEYKIYDKMVEILNSFGYTLVRPPAITVGE